MANKKALAPITFEDAKIVFRNFSGKEGRFNRAGDRNFALLLEAADAEAMLADGWNVKYLKPREEGDDPRPYIQVTIGFKGRPPRIVMITSRGQTNLDEESVDILDWANIAKTDLIIRPYEWEVNGNTGVKAYLKSIFLTIDEDELEAKYGAAVDSAQNTVGFSQSDDYFD